MPNDPIIYTSDLIDTLYYLLYAKYGNSSIASSDPNQFKYQVFSTIFKYGPAWKGRLKIQEQLFNLEPDSEDVQNGTINFYNHAENPDTAPETDAYQILEGINSQNTNLYKRGKLEGYSLLNDLINTDVTEEFLGKFKKFFIQVVMPQAPLWYQNVEGYDGEYSDDVNSTVYGNYRTSTFQQIWEDADSFKYDYEHCGIPTTI